MHTLNHKKLLGLSAAATAFLALPAGTQAQIAYTNFDPDIVLDPDTDPWPHSEDLYYNLDMNLDGDIDFYFRAFASVSYSGWLTSNYYMNQQWMWPNDLQAFAGTLPEPWYYNASVMDYGMLINNDLNWVEDNLPAGNKTAQLKKYYHTPGTVVDNGNWGGENGKFVAVRLRTPGQKFYGWVRISVSPLGDSLTIHDFAYNTVSNAPITAGETGLVCAPPFPYITQVVSPTQVKVKWQQTENAANYRIRYREIGATEWISVKASASKSSKILSGLNCGVAYEWQIRATCTDGSISDWSDMQNFVPASCRLADASEPTAQVELFPNPTGGMMHINVDGFTQDLLEAIIVDMQGSIVRTFVLNQQEPSVISVEDLPVGNYMMRISDGIMTETAQFIVVE